MNNSEVKKYSLGVCLVVDALISQIELVDHGGGYIAPCNIANLNRVNKKLMFLISKATGTSHGDFSLMGGLVSASWVKSKLLEYISGIRDDELLQLVVDALISQISTKNVGDKYIAGCDFARLNFHKKTLILLISKASGISLADYSAMDSVSIDGIRSDLLEYVSKLGVSDGFSLGGYIKPSGKAEVVGVVVSGFSGVNFSGPGCGAASSNNAEDIKVSGMKLKYTLDERLKIIDGIAMTLNYAELDDDIKLKLTEKLNMVIDSI